MEKSTNIISRIIAGVVIMVLSLWFVLFAGFIDGPKIDYVAIILGAFFFLIGFFVAFNKDEDKIEKIKN
jgi:Flp pilus assembly protein protease CpaA